MNKVELFEILHTEYRQVNNKGNNFLIVYGDNSDLEDLKRQIDDEVGYKIYTTTQELENEKV